jgi:hypothetical protein
MAIVLDGTANTVTPLNGALGATTPSTVVATTVTASSTIKGASTIAVGNATPSASGAGITFPATQSASTNANTLDDYEEGTWTPTATSSGGGSGQTYSAQLGKYTKIGNLVTCQFLMTLTAMGTYGSTVYAIGGLPFEPSASFDNAGAGNTGYLTNSTTSIVSLFLNVSSGALAYTNALTVAGTSISNVKLWSNSCDVRGTLTYYV